MADASTTPPSNPMDTTSFSFCEFLVSLGSSALVHLGEVDDPTTGGPNPDMTLARHTIELLSVLQHKTDGNLDEDERTLLNALLQDLNAKLSQASNQD